MNGPKRMTAADDVLWGLRQAGRRLERYVEDFIEHIEFILFIPLLLEGISSPQLTPPWETSTYRPNGSDHLHNSKHPLLLRSFASVLSPDSPSVAHSSARSSRARSSARSSRVPTRCHSFPKENVWGGGICPWQKRLRPRRFRHGLLSPRTRHGRPSSLRRPGGLPCLHPGPDSNAPFSFNFIQI